MPIKLANNASGTLATAISASDTGVALTTGNGSAFPTLAAGEYFYATLTSSAGTQEIVKATARSGDSLTIVRAQEGTAAQSFAAGARFELRVTTKSITDTIYDITRYQGASATNPTARLNGEPLIVGDFYFNTGDNSLRFYNGSAWQSVAIGTLASSSVTHSAAVTSLLTATDAKNALDDLSHSSTGSTKVGFLQAGSGATSRTVQAKLRESVSVKDFGATGDGTTDDRAAIQLAIDAAASVRGEVIFPSTTTHYLVNLTSSSLVVPSNVSIVGAGYGAKLKADSTSLLPMFACGGSSNITFDGLHLVGNLATQKSASSSSSAISGLGASNVVVRNCVITDWTRHSINLDGADGVLVETNTIARTWWGSGVLVGNTAVSANVIVQNNRVSTTQQGNIQAYVGPGRLIVSGNICDGTDLGVTQLGGGAVSDNITAYAEDVNGVCSEVVISNNVCRNSGNHGIHVGGDGLVVTNNSIYYPFNTGVFIAKGDNVTPDPMTGAIVSNNYVKFLAGGAGLLRGIVVRNVSAYTVTGNTVLDPKYGIEINGLDTAGVGCINGVVSGNNVFDHTLAGVWLRNKVTANTINTNSLKTTTGTSEDVREDLVGAVSADNSIFANITSGTSTQFAQVYRSTDNSIIQFGNANGVHLRVGSTTASIVNYLNLVGSAGTSAPFIASAGTATNLDLQFAPKGTGVLRFGTLTANADAPVSGYITIKDSGGTVRKLAVIT